jgi:hypothetical protein
MRDFTRGRGQRDMQPGLIEQVDHNRKVGLLDKVLGHPSHTSHTPGQLPNFPKSERRDDLPEGI